MLPQELHTFWNYREDLSMENGLITKGARLLIPSTLRKKVLEQIHDEKYQKLHVLVLKLFIIFTRTISGPYTITWLECRQTNMFDAKTLILY